MKLKQTILSIGFLLGVFLASAQVNIMVEAESGDLTGTTQLKNNDNASAGVFLQLKNPSSVSFAANGIPEAGTYKLNIYNFNGGATQDVTLTVNGASTTVTLVASNWAYQGVAQRTSLDVDLNAGDNTLTVSFLNVGVSLDYFEIINGNPPSNGPTTYYLSEEGNDLNDGRSEATPWKTIDKLNDVVGSACTSGCVGPGDKVLFKRGDSFYGHLEFHQSGTEEELIEISSYGDENEEFPILSGSGGTITGGDYFEAVTITNASHILVSKIWVKNDRRDGSRYTWGEYTSFGVKLVANKWGGIMSNVTFRDVKVSDVFGLSIPPPSEFNSLKATGIRMESEADEADFDVRFENILVEDSYFTHIGKAGVWAIHKGDLDTEDGTVNRNRDIVVRNNTFYRTGGSGVILSKTYNGLIENNDFDQTGYSDGVENRLAGRGSGAWVFSCQNIIAQFNRSYGVQGPNDSYGMHIDFGNKDIIFQYNYSEESAGGFCEILGKNINSTYRFNVSVNDGIRDFHGSTIWVSDFAGTGVRISSDHNYVYNNTIYLAKNYKPDISIVGKNTYVYNNIFRVTDGIIGEHVTIEIDAGSQLYVSNNLFDGNIASSFSNLDANSQSGNPLFVNEGDNKEDGYDIQEGSPAIDNGKSFPEPNFPMAGSGIFSHITNVPTTDTFGVPVDIMNVAPNIGASNAHNSNVDLGVDNPENTQAFFTIYPNPVKEHISLQLKKELDNAEYVIYDVQGRPVFSRAVENKSHKIQLPENLKNGIYFLKIIDGTAAQASQFVLYR